MCVRRGVIPRASAIDTGLLKVYVQKSWEIEAEHLRALEDLKGPYRAIDGLIEHYRAFIGPCSAL